MSPNYNSAKRKLHASGHTVIHLGVSPNSRTHEVEGGSSYVNHLPAQDFEGVVVLDEELDQMTSPSRLVLIVV